MEGIENPLVPNTPKPSLRLMRFSFEPNTPLLNETRSFVHESRRPTTPIRFYASRQLLLGIPDFYTHEGSLQQLNRTFSARTEPLHIAPSIKSKELPNGSTRFQIRVDEQQAFDEMTSLDIKTEHRFDKNLMYGNVVPNVLPNEIGKQPDTGHYLFIDIATSALIGVKDQEMAEYAFVRKAEAHKFFVHTLALNSIRDIHPSRYPRKSETQPSVTEHANEDESQLPKAG